MAETTLALSSKKRARSLTWRTKRSFKPVFRLALSFVVFYSSVLTPYAAETEFWSQRRNAAQKLKSEPSLAQPVPALGLSADEQTRAGLSAEQYQLLAQLPRATNFEFGVTENVAIGAPLGTEPGSRVTRDLASASRPKSEGDATPTWLSTLVLPFGSIRDIHISRTAGAPLVIHIQDAHEIEEAQKNMAAMIQGLREERGVSLVGLEGAQGAFNIDPYRGFPDESITRDIAAQFLKSGYIGGPEYAALTAQEPPILWGLEDLSLYESNIQSFKDSLRFKPQVQDFLTASRAALAGLKDKIYSPELKEFDRHFEAHKSRQESLGVYVRYLMSATPGASRGFLNLHLLLDALTWEETLDFKRVEKQRLELVELLAKRLSEDQLSLVVQQSLLYRLGRMSYGDYHRFLRKVCRDNGIDLEPFAQLNSYVTYVLLAEQINRNELLIELSELESAAQEALAATSGQKRLAGLNRDLMLLDKLTAHSMTQADWYYYYSHRDQVLALGKDLSEMARQVGVPAPAAPSDLAGLIRPFEEFCEYAMRRNTGLIENLMAKMRERGASSAVLVAGGFHSDGLTQILRQKDASYVVVTPKINKVPKDSHYLDVFARDPLPLEKLFSGDTIYLKFPLRLAASLPEGYAEAARLLRTWFAAEQTGLLVQKAVEAGAGEAPEARQEALREAIAGLARSAERLGGVELDPRQVEVLLGDTVVFDAAVAGVGLRMAVTDAVKEESIRKHLEEEGDRYIGSSVAGDKVLIFYGAEKSALVRLWESLGDMVSSAPAVPAAPEETAPAPEEEIDEEARAIIRELDPAFRPIRKLSGLMNLTGEVYEVERDGRRYALKFAGGMMGRLDLNTTLSNFQHEVKMARRMPARFAPRVYEAKAALGTFEPQVRPFKDRTSNRRPDESKKFMDRSYILSELLAGKEPPAALDEGLIGQEAFEREHRAFLEASYAEGLVFYDHRADNFRVDASGRLTMFDYGSYIEAADDGRSFERAVDAVALFKNVAGRRPSDGFIRWALGFLPAGEETMKALLEGESGEGFLDALKADPAYVADATFFDRLDASPAAKQRELFRGFDGRLDPGATLTLEGKPYQIVDPRTHMDGADLAAGLAPSRESHPATRMALADGRPVWITIVKNYEHREVLRRVSEALRDGDLAGVWSGRLLQDAEGHYFFVSEYLRGETFYALQKADRSEGVAGDEAAYRLLRRASVLANALKGLHKAGVMHGDAHGGNVRAARHVNFDTKAEEDFLFLLPDFNTSSLTAEPRHFFRDVRNLADLAWTALEEAGLAALPEHAELTAALREIARADFDSSPVKSMEDMSRLLLKFLETYHDRAQASKPASVLWSLGGFWAGKLYTTWLAPLWETGAFFTLGALALGWSLGIPAFDFLFMPHVGVSLATFYGVASIVTLPAFVLFIAAHSAVAALKGEGDFLELLASDLTERGPPAAALFLLHAAFLPLGLVPAFIATYLAHARINVKALRAGAKPLSIFGVAGEEVNPNSPFKRGTWTPVLLDEGYNASFIRVAIARGLIVPLGPTFEVGGTNIEFTLPEELPGSQIVATRKALLESGVVTPDQLSRVALVAMEEPKDESSLEAGAVIDSGENPRVLHNRSMSFGGFRIKGGGAASHREEGSPEELGHKTLNGLEYAFDRGSDSNHALWGGFERGFMNSNVHWMGVLQKALDNVLRRHPGMDRRHPWLMKIFPSAVASFQPLLLPARRAAGQTVSESDVIPEGALHALRGMNTAIHGRRQDDVVWVKNPAQKIDAITGQRGIGKEERVFINRTPAPGRTVELGSRHKNARYRDLLWQRLFDQLGIPWRRQGGATWDPDGRRVASDDVLQRVRHEATAGLAAYFAVLQEAELGSTGGVTGRPSDNRNTLFYTGYEDLDTLQSAAPGESGFISGKDYLTEQFEAHEAIQDLTFSPDRDYPDADLAPVAEMLLWSYADPHSSFDQADPSHVRRAKAYLGTVLDSLNGMAGVLSVLEKGTAWQQGRALFLLAWALRLGATTAAERDAALAWMESHHADAGKATLRRSMAAALGEFAAAEAGDAARTAGAFRVLAALRTAHAASGQGQWHEIAASEINGALAMYPPSLFQDAADHAGVLASLLEEEGSGARDSLLRSLEAGAATTSSNDVMGGIFPNNRMTRLRSALAGLPAAERRLLIARLQTEAGKEPVSLHGGLRYAEEVLLPLLSGVYPLVVSAGKVSDAFLASLENLGLADLASDLRIPGLFYSALMPALASADVLDLVLKAAGQSVAPAAGSEHGELIGRAVRALGLEGTLSVRVIRGPPVSGVREDEFVTFFKTAEGADVLIHEAALTAWAAKETSMKWPGYAENALKIALAHEHLEAAGVEHGLLLQAGFSLDALDEFHRSGDAASRLDDLISRASQGRLFARTPDGFELADPARDATAETRFHPFHATASALRRTAALRYFMSHLRTGLRSTDHESRRRAVQALGELGAALAVAGESGFREWLPLYEAALRDDDEYIRADAVESLGAVGAALAASDPGGLQTYWREAFIRGMRVELPNSVGRTSSVLRQVAAGLAKQDRAAGAEGALMAAAWTPLFLEAMNAGGFRQWGAADALPGAVALLREANAGREAWRSFLSRVGPAYGAAVAQRKELLVAAGSMAHVSAAAGDEGRWLEAYLQSIREGSPRTYLYRGAPEAVRALLAAGDRVGAEEVLNYYTAGVRNGSVNGVTATFAELAEALLSDPAGAEMFASRWGAIDDAIRTLVGTFFSDSKRHAVAALGVLAEHVLANGDGSLDQRVLAWRRVFDPIRLPKAAPANEEVRIGAAEALAGLARGLLKADPSGQALVDVWVPFYEHAMRDSAVRVRNAAGSSFEAIFETLRDLEDADALRVLSAVMPLYGHALDKYPSQAVKAFGTFAAFAAAAKRRGVRAPDPRMGWSGLLVEMFSRALKRNSESARAAALSSPSLVRALRELVPDWDAFSEQWDPVYLLMAGHADPVVREGALLGAGALMSSWGTRGPSGSVQSDWEAVRDAGSRGFTTNGKEHAVMRLAIARMTEGYPDEVRDAADAWRLAGEALLAGRETVQNGWPLAREFLSTLFEALGRRGERLDAADAESVYRRYFGLPDSYKFYRRNSTPKDLWIHILFDLALRQNGLSPEIAERLREKKDKPTLKEMTALMREVLGRDRTILAALEVAHAKAADVPAKDLPVGSSRVDLQACKLEYSIVSPK